MNPPAVRVAAGQIGASHGDVDANVRRTVETILEASRRGVHLLVMPECGLTGYVYDSLEEVSAVAIDLDGPHLRQIEDTARDHGIHVVVGFLERRGDDIHNTVVLFGPGGRIAEYRKTHLPCLGADRFVTQGQNEPVVATTAIGSVGLSICYDLRFPEWARCLALGGADIIANPTNWPEPAERVAELFTRVRAAENHVFVVVANRGDEERGVPFIGKSQIIDPAGSVLAASEREEGMIFADIDPASAREKVVSTPEANFSASLMGDRRPELYGALTESRAVAHH
jgi:predicted amidohydrolase